MKYASESLPKRLRFYFMCFLTLKCENTNLKNDKYFLHNNMI